MIRRFLALFYGRPGQRPDPQDTDRSAYERAWANITRAYPIPLPENPPSVWLLLLALETTVVAMLLAPGWAVLALLVTAMVGAFYQGRRRP